MSDREMPYHDVNAVLKVEDTLSAYATDCGIDFRLSNGQRIRGVPYEGKMHYYLLVDSDEEDTDQEQGGDGVG